MTPDFGATALDYAEHRAGFPDTLFERLAALGIGAPGHDVLDIGTGTGSLARGFARSGAHVVGVDPAEPMLAQARALAASEGLEVAFRVGRAEATGLPDASFDVVAAGQCWHWFDRAAAAAEALRLLRPGGHVVIAHFDWLPLPGNLVAATEALIERHNPAWNLGGGTGVYPAWLRDLGEAGFAGIASFSFDVAVKYTPAAWRGRIRASAGVGGSLPPEAVARFDEALAALLDERFPGEAWPVPHRVFAVTARRPDRTA